MDSLHSDPYAVTSTRRRSAAPGTAIHLSTAVVEVAELSIVTGLPVRIPANVTDDSGSS